jgi:hypothetical protein
LIKTSSFDSANLGYYGINVNFKELTCKYELVAASLRRDISWPVNVSDDDDGTYDKTLVSYSIFSDYLVNTNTYRCPHSDCKLLLNCNTASVISTSPSPFELRLIAANDTFQVNTDPIWEFDRSVCLQCSNKYSAVKSLTFTSKVSCPNSIKIWQPSNLVS